MVRPLASYASKPEETRGRLHPEPEHSIRSPFQRDRDRIIHSTAFRRLIHKTQVFVYHEGDHYRTRLTHSLEVAQIARTISRALRLEEDLAETVPWPMISATPHSAMPAKTLSTRRWPTLEAFRITITPCAS